MGLSARKKVARSPCEHESSTLYGGRLTTAHLRGMVRELIDLRIPHWICLRFLRRSSVIKILLVGKDFRLLATRAAILSRTGASTVCCNPAEMKRELAGEKFDVVVLCHSLLPEEAGDDVVGLARRWWPQAKIWLVHSDLPRVTYEEILHDAVIPADPVGMLRETLTLLRGLSKNPVEELLPPRALVEG